jgi:spore coat assemly protein
VKEHQFTKGDIVARRSYSTDVLFKITDITVDEAGVKHAVLRGIDVRLFADAPLSDLERVSPSKISEYKQQSIRQNRECLKRIFTRRQIDKERHSHRSASKEEADFFEIPGKVLHIDGDGEYLELCMTTYKQLSINAKGLCISEDEQPKIILAMLKKYMPDILVLTGHDGFVKDRRNFADVNSYRNSKHFIESVKIARQYQNSKDELIIFAGACQSHYEAILEAGANYASSPKRIFIHAFDPVFIVEKLAYTPIHETVSIKDVIANTITGYDGVGGIETRGKFRIGMPKSPY